MQEIETKLRENLVSIMGLDSIDQVQPGSSLVRDLGAESIDFVEIMYMIETVFGVKVKIGEIAKEDYGADGLSDNVRLSEETAAKLNKDLDSDQFKAGQTTAEIFELLTVHNLAVIISNKLAEAK